MLGPGHFDGAQFGICGKSVISVRRNVVAAVLPWLRRLGFRWKQRKTENLLEISCCGRTNRFYLFGGYDEKSAALIQGVTFAGVLLDEVALMPRSFVEQACARCSVEGARLWFNCNPEGPQHWFYREWICKAAARNALYLHFTMEDNPSLSERVRRRYRNSTPARFTGALSLGEWTAAQGLVYDFFDAERDCVPPPKEPCESYVVSGGLRNGEPRVLRAVGQARFGVVPHRRVLLRLPAGGAAENRRGIRGDLLRLLDGRRAEAVIVDPSAASFIEALRRTGLRVRRADNDVLSGIRITAGMLKEKRSCFAATVPTACGKWDSTAGRPRRAGRPLQGA